MAGIFLPKQAKVGNEELENWLARDLKPRVDFKFVEVFTDKGKVVVMEIPAAVNRPTSFKDVEFICIGSYKKKLKDYPDNRDSIIHNMEDEEFIRQMDNGNYEITNMGALLFAKDLKSFTSLKRKAIRVIRYKGSGQPMRSGNRFLPKAMQFSVMILLIILCH